MILNIDTSSICVGFYFFNAVWYT